MSPCAPPARLSNRSCRGTPPCFSLMIVANRDRMSALKDWGFLLNTSGAMKGSVPATVFAIFTSFDRPKSPRRKWYPPSSSKSQRMFSGFISLWTSLCDTKQSSAWSI